MKYIVEHFGTGFLEICGFTVAAILLFSILGKGGILASEIVWFFNSICG